MNSSISLRACQLVLLLTLPFGTLADDKVPAAGKQAVESTTIKSPPQPASAAASVSGSSPKPAEAASKPADTASVPKAADAASKPGDAPTKVADPTPKASSDLAAKVEFKKGWLDPRVAAQDIDDLLPKLEPIRVVSQHDFIPSRGPFTLLVFKTFAEKDAVEAGGEKTERLTYRALIVPSSHGSDGASKLESTGTLRQVLTPAGVWSERATRGTSAAPGTDFKRDETPEGKTLLHLDADIDSDSFSWPWRHARVYVVGAAGPEGNTPRVIGSFETVVASKPWAVGISVVAALFVYIAAACATFLVHRSQRIYKDPPIPLVLGGVARKPGYLDIFKGSFTNAQANQDKGHGPLVGTNYATFWANLNPVVLSAGSNGMGSATNLQILFFSLVVFSVVSYIWLLTGQLTGLSDTVLLLMGISGLGATAAAGAELTKNRLTFDNWAWLINRCWLPPGGVAEVNVARWKDIFTTGGAFDVYRFQMICFSVVVGIALVGAGTQLNDLSSFNVPQALLGILGLSQAVYVAGKLVAPPSISDLDTQISALQAAEKKLRDAIDQSAAAFAPAGVVSWTGDDKLAAAKSAYADYMELWRKTATMFETTLGRSLPPAAQSKCPPFTLPDAVLDQLPAGKVSLAYSTDILLIGAPGAGPYRWSLESGKLPTGMQLVPAANNVDLELSIAPGALVAGDYAFTLRVTGATADQTRTKVLRLRID